MASIIPKLRTRFGENIGVELFIQPPDLSSNESTFISTDVSAAASSLSVENGLKFSVSEYLVVGNIGAEKSEIVQAHASTTPTVTTITLAAGTDTDHAHSRGERVVFIPYNQVAIERSTDSGATYSALATIALRVDTTEIYYQHTAGASTDYYRVRFSNSTSSNTSAYSDGIIATGYADGTAGSVIRSALLALGEEIDDRLITKEFLLTALHDGRKEVDNHTRIERWSFRTVFDYDAGNVIPGRFQLTLPTDLRDPDTYKNILSIRIGKDNLPLDPKDKRKINEWYRGVARTTLNGVVTDVDTTITLTSSGDFDESGSVDVAAGAVSGTIDSVAYTANNESTNVLSGVTGIATGGHATGTLVWQGASFGYPTEYTVFDGAVTFSQPFNDDLAGENIWMDYYQKITRADSDGDTLDEPFYDVYVPYMKWRIKLRKNPSLSPTTDPDYLDWIEKREAQVDKEWAGVDLTIEVDIP